MWNETIYAGGFKDLANKTFNYGCFLDDANFVKQYTKYIVSIARKTIDEELGLPSRGLYVSSTLKTIPNTASTSKKKPRATKLLT